MASLDLGESCLACGVCFNGYNYQTKEKKASYHQEKVKSPLFYPLVYQNKNHVISYSVVENCNLSKSKSQVHVVQGNSSITEYT